MQEDSLKKRYIFKLFANIVSGIIGIIIVALVPKALGPIAYGQFVYLQDFFMKIIGFLDMGTSMAFFTKLSANHNRKNLITFYLIYIFLVLFLINALLYFLKGVGYIDLILPGIPNEYIYMGAFFGFFTWVTQIFIKISDAYALTVSVELVKISNKIISVLLLGYLIYFTSFFSLDVYFYFNYFILIIFIIMLFVLFIKNNIFVASLLKIRYIDVRSITKEFVEYSSPLLPYNVLGIFVGLFDIWLLQKTSGSIQTGYYGLAYGLAATCFLFTGAMTPIITREFAKAFGQKDIEHMKKLFFRYVPMLYSLAAYFGIFISLQSENILIIFTDEKFKDAYLVLVIMAFYPIYQTYGQLGGSVFQATGQTKIIRNISFLHQPIGLLLSFIFIYLLDYGAVGLASKMVLGQVIGVNIQLYFNAKYLSFKIKYFLIHQISVVILFTILAYIANNIFDFKSAVVDLLFSGMIYSFFVIISVYIFPEIFALNKVELKQIMKRLFNVIKK